MRIAVLAALVACSGSAAPERLRESGAASGSTDVAESAIAPKWNRYAWCSLVEVQQALAAGRHEEALQAAATAEQQSLSLPERMWLSIYSGFALDELGRRDEAVLAYRAAAHIHPHSLATLGIEKPLRDIKHIRNLSRALPDGWQMRSQLLSIEDVTLQWCALVPKQPEHRQATLIRIGHPADEGLATSRILELSRAQGVPMDMIVVHTNVIATVSRERHLLVDDPELVAEVPRRFDAVLQSVLRELPADPRRAYLMGYSYDGVWALILGLSRPDSYAGVVALSAVTYPAPIANSIASGNARRIPVCILRGDRDHMFPRRLDQERRTGADIMRAHPRSLWKLLPETTHVGVLEQAGLCYRRILAARRSGEVVAPP